MDRQEAIERLKQNEKPFGLMGSNKGEREQMQLLLMRLSEAKGRDIQVYCDGGAWDTITIWSCGLTMEHAYRLRPDYTEQPEVIEVEFQAYDTDRDMVIKTDSFCRSYVLSPAIRCIGGQSVRFAGYKYADGTVRQGPVHAISGRQNNLHPMSLEFPVSALFVRAK